LLKNLKKLQIKICSIGFFAVAFKEINLLRVLNLASYFTTSGTGSLY